MNIAPVVFYGLTNTNNMRIEPSTASKYAMFAQDLGTYIQNNKALLDRLVLAMNVAQLPQDYNTAVQASTLVANGNALGLSVQGFRDVEEISGANVLGTSFAIVQALAVRYGIQLNPCAAAIANLSVDFVGALGAGGATVAVSETGVGLVVGVVITAMKIYSTASDAYSLGTSCIDPAIQSAVSRH